MKLGDVGRARLEVRVSVRELAELRRIAAANHMTMSAWARLAMATAAAESHEVGVLFDRRRRYTRVHRERRAPTPGRRRYDATFVRTSDDSAVRLVSERQHNAAGGQSDRNNRNAPVDAAPARRSS